MIDQNKRSKGNFTYLWNRLTESQFKLIQPHWNTSTSAPNYPRKGEICLYFPQRYSKHPGASKLYFVALVTEVHFGRTIPDYKTGNNYKTRMNTSNDFPTSVSLQYVQKNTIKTCKNRFASYNLLICGTGEVRETREMKNKNSDANKKGKTRITRYSPQSPIQDIREVLEPE